MITVNNVSLRFGKRTLFEGVNLKFTPGNCYGIIGANGAGKSTFLKLLSGEIETTSGEINIGKDERISVLKQDHNLYNDYRVIDTVIMGNKRLYEIIEEKNFLYTKEPFTDKDGIKLGELESEFAFLNGWQAESDAAILLSGLGVDIQLHELTMKEIPTKEKVKVLLAQALFGNPDVLLLDEPAAEAEEGKAEGVIERLYYHYLKHVSELPPEFTKYIDEDGPDRIAADYIACMTDRYAVRDYTRLFVPADWA